MTDGSGKYDYLATYVRTQAQAVGVVVIIGGGKYGDGFSVEVTSQAQADGLVAVLRDVANQIEADIKRRVS